MHRGVAYISIGGLLQHFFFSSRRRHTRWPRDWSSDVCSSDLMFTEESFQAVRDRLAPRGVMAIYNYFREKWLVDRLANTLTAAFGEPPRAYVHEDRAYLAVILAGQIGRASCRGRAWSSACERS